ncbi:MAG: YceI family protein [Phycisphaerales bacterium]|nr:YceI family protein [Phycisphaerales bacterium]
MRLHLTVAALVSVASLLILPNGATGHAMAQAERYQVDPMHSSVVFRVKHMNVANFYGRFNEISGTVEIDEDGSGRIEVTINTDSLDTNSRDRDKHMKGEEFFDVAKYPEIKFRSNDIQKSGADTFVAKGEMTMHGQTRPLTATLKRTGAGADPWGGFRAGYETKFTVKRTEFGMDGSLKALGDEVDVIVSLECMREKQQ